MSVSPHRRTTRRRPALGAVLTLALAGGLTPVAFTGAATATPSPAPAQAEDLIISEYVEGSSTNKAIEFFNGTTESIDLTAYTLEVYFNGSTTASFTTSLEGTLEPDDAYVFADAALSEFADQTTAASLWNGDDAIVLRQGDTVVDSLGQVGFDPGSAWEQNGVSTQNMTIRRLDTVCAGDTDPSDVFDPSAQYAAFPIDTFDGLGAHSLGECGDDPEPPDPEPVPECGTPATLIGEVQGSGASTPIPGEVVEIEGTVVGDFQTGGYNGFYVQDAGDGDPLTSDGIFVFHPAAPAVDLGDTVRVVGPASEYFGMTQISATSTAVCATGGDLPEPVEVTLPFEALDEPERYEGMYVTMPQDLAILEYFNYGRFGEIVIGSQRQYQPTATFPPGSPEAEALFEANALDRITLDDGRSSQNPDPAVHPNGAEFDLDNLFRGGDLVTGATGVLDYRFDLYRIQPTQGAEYTAANPRTPAPQVDGEITVGAFNVLNYFTTLGERGADTPEEFERQEAKIVSAIVEMDADVLGLVEIENNDDLALTTLVDAVNEELGEERYAALETGDIGTDQITTAFIYQPETVTPEGDFAILDSSVDPDYIDTLNRPSLAQTFAPVAGDEDTEAVTVSINHLKSKGSSCESVGDPEDPNGQGNCNGVRTDAAEALAAWLETDPTGTGAENALVVGDLNSYDYEDPIVALTDAGYTDLLKEFIGEDAYTYVFDGQLGYLDHALANEAALEHVVETAVWTANADEASLIDYDMTFKQPAQQAIFSPDAYRASDHDAVLVGLQLSDAPVDPEPIVDRLPGDQRYDTARLVSALYPDGVETVVIANGQDAFSGADALAAAPVAAGGFFVDGTATAVADPAPGASPVLLVQSDRIPDDTRAALAALAPENIVVLGGEAAVSDAVLADLTTFDAVVERVTGENRYETAATVAERMGEVEVVYIAKGQAAPGDQLALADALTGGARAGIDGAPVLLTKTGALPRATRDALEDLGDVEIRVLGGNDAVADSVLSELATYGEVSRVAGDDRWETAVELTESTDPGVERLYVASGQTFPDALTASALSASSGVPLLIVKADGVPNVVLDEVLRLDPAHLTIVGGTGAVGQGVEDQLADALGVGDGS